ncbi:hypothetical protein NA57DRAFT_50692 [Rhizodiscina lignyota]|uniref:Uncharacterized protein n=1 Tax=Rhizodiscina lignyota TaxID=1504668 RepID=A0A9P4MB06_9PEZI|nr:hypothetical protein NA57DRAFT_50692 [Rhizodiscina lignyota]
MPEKLTPLDEQRIAGPYTLFQGSFTLELLKPDSSRNATTLLRTTFKHDHPLVETFQVLKGSIGTTTTYSKIDTIRTPDMGPVNVRTMVPHSIWPDPNATEDSVLLMWAHPTDVPGPMDSLFFKNLFMYVADVDAGEVKMDLLQIMLMQHVTQSAMVMLPSAWWLGPLRWWIPWQLQRIGAAIARLCGYKPWMKRYTTEEDFKILAKVGSSDLSSVSTLC